MIGDFLPRAKINRTPRQAKRRENAFRGRVAQNLVNDVAGMLQTTLPGGSTFVTATVSAIPGPSTYAVNLEQHGHSGPTDGGYPVLYGLIGTP